MEFTEFGLHGDLLKGLASAGYVTCTPVQEQVLKTALEGVDLYVQSQTGTGKTAAYLTAIIEEMLTRTESAGRKTLVLVPTRELAVQVEDEAAKLLSGSALVCSSFYGGVGYDKQIARLKKGVDIIIGTPGRIIDLQESGSMDLSGTGFLVIDEADRMFDMGFYPDLRTLLKVLPGTERRQTMLFSATLNSYVKNLAWEYTRDAKEITIEAESVTVDDIDQHLIHVSSEDKVRLLLGILDKEKPDSVIIFCNTKRMCEVLSKRLKINGMDSGFIIGDMPQPKRLAVLDSFRERRLRVLVATDVAARGIDVDDLAMVVNFDLPKEAENYVHRIGRTARAGKKGVAYTLCSEQDVYDLVPIERYIEKQIPAETADPALLAEDKSAGQYIRTENWHEDHDERREARERRRGSRQSGSSRNERGAERRRERGSGRYSAKNDAKRGEYRRDRRVGKDTGQFAEDLSKLSFEERMKFYKEKYGGSDAGSRGTAGSPKKRRKKGAAAQGQQKRKGQNNKAQSRPADSSHGAATGQPAAQSKAAAPKKQSVLSRIRSFFGGKK